MKKLNPSRFLPILRLAVLVAAAGGLVSGVAAGATPAPVLTWARQFGLAGPAGTFRYPTADAVDTHGNLFVLDTDNNRVQKWTRAGTYETEWGSFGAGAGQFQYPLGIAVDAAGHVYVADTLNDRIQKFSGSGKFLGRWGGYGTGEKQFDHPMGVAVDAGGDMFIADTYNNRVQKLSKSGAFMTQWDTSGTVTGQFNWPGGVAVDTGNNVYVADVNNNCVEKFDNGGNFLNAWDLSSDPHGMLNQPSAVAVNMTTGDIYVADSGNSRVVEMDSSGGFLTAWGTAGTAVKQFGQSAEYGGVRGLAVDKTGLVYVADQGNNRIQRFTAAGVFLRAWGKHSNLGALSSPYGVAVDKTGDVYVVDTGNSCVQEFSSTGDCLRQWGKAGIGRSQFISPVGIAVAPSGNVYVADTGNSRIQEFTSTGAFVRQWGGYGSDNGQFKDPWGVAVDTAGYVYVADTVGWDVQKFGPNGGFKAKWTASSGKNGAPFQYPRSIATDSNNNVYVTETSNLSLPDYRIQKISHAGVYLGEGGSAGTANGQFGATAGPGGLALDVADRIYVADPANNRFQVFGPAFGFLTKRGVLGVGAGADFNAPFGIAVDTHGNVYVADTGNNRIQVFAPAVAPVVAAALAPLSVSVASVRAGAGGRLQIVFTLSAEASVEAEVVNIAGRPIRTVVTGYAAPAGINTLAWDGRSETGALVPNGTYLLRIIARTDAGAQTEATAACNVTR